tara:strand:+ start:184 stop:420 length:237 start_codon:yes stop_codon:yes gene_type:complete
MYEINNDIPIPDVRSPRNNKYDLHKMGIGDSFSLPYEDHKVQKVRVAVANYGSRNAKKFVTRKIFENNDELLRVWRTV